MLFRSNIKNDKQRNNTIDYKDYGDLLTIEGDKYSDIGNPNNPGNSYIIQKGDRLAQLVIVPIWTPELKPVEEFESETARGESGFGSSGTR